MKKNPTNQKTSILGAIRGNTLQNGETKADWAEADPKLIQHCIVEIGKRNGAIRFGYTRDGNAYTIGLYLGDDRDTIYCRPYEDIDSLLRQIGDGLEAAAVQLELPS